MKAERVQRERGADLQGMGNRWSEKTAITCEKERVGGGDGRKGRGYKRSKDEVDDDLTSIMSTVFN